MWLAEAMMHIPKVAPSTSEYTSGPASRSGMPEMRVKIVNSTRKKKSNVRK